ncbi:MAG: FHA domain-containing protein [Cellvibrionaceae bacterium]
MLKLRFKNNKHNAVWLVEPKVTIGRANGNDLVINDPDVAPQHAEILVRHEKLTLVNIAGQPLSVNRKPVEKNMPLDVNDILLLGQTQLEVIDPKREQRPAAKGESTGWALKANHTALANRVFTIKSETVIGRSNECDITLAAAHLSRRHVKLMVRDGLLYARDLGSANGTYLNGERISEARVRRGDELRFDTLSFGVIGPASEDLDKTTIRPASAVGFKPDIGRPQQAGNQNARSAQERQAGKSAVRSERSAAGAGMVSAQRNGSAGRSKLAWTLGLFLAIALAAGVAWQQGLINP